MDCRSNIRSWAMPDFFHISPCLRLEYRGQQRTTNLPLFRNPASVWPDIGCWRPYLLYQRIREFVYKSGDFRPDYGCMEVGGRKHHVRQNRPYRDGAEFGQGPRRWRLDGIRRSNRNLDIRSGRWQLEQRCFVEQRARRSYCYLAQFGQGISRGRLGQQLHDGICQRGNLRSGDWYLDDRQ